MKPIFNELREFMEMMGKIIAGNNFYMLEPSSYPLFTFLYNLSRREAPNVRFSWLERMNGQSIEAYNICQRFKKTIEVRAEGHPDDRPYMRKKRLIEMMRDIEKAMFYGNRHEYEGGGATMGGLNYFIPTYRYETFVRDLPYLVRSWGSNYMLFCSPEILNSIMNMHGLDITEMDRGRTYFVRIWDFVVDDTPEVKHVYLVKHNYLNGNDVFKVCLNKLMFRYKMDICLNTDVGPYTDEALCVCGIEIRDCFDHGRYIIP